MPNNYATAKSRSWVKIAAAVGIVTVIVAIVLLLPEIVPFNQPGPLQMAVTILLPEPVAYGENSRMLSCRSGELDASVFEPLPPGFHYQQAGDHVVIEASS